MLTMFRWIALIAAVIFVMSLAGAILSSQNHASPSDPSATEKSQKEDGPKKQEVALFDRWFPDSTSVFNLFLVIFTGVLAFGGLYQLGLLVRAERLATITAQAAKNSADTGRHALLDTQRPFVFVGTFQVEVVNTEVFILARFDNSGVTPAVKVRNYVSWKASADAPPGDYNWPDIGKDGKPLSGPGEGVTSFIGPKDTMFSETLKIPMSTMEAIRLGQARLFVWGWIEYDDMFDGTPRHRTEFCNEMVATNLKNFVDEGKHAIAASFARYGEHNRAN
jgi:hypothetical protein